jgi:hypothetical protein
MGYENNLGIQAAFSTLSHVFLDIKLSKAQCEIENM